MTIEEQLIELGGSIQHHFGGGVYIKQTAIPAGTYLEQHRHDHDHLSVLVSGWVRLEVDGEAKDVSAPAVLVLEARSVHKVTAYTDSIWLCVWGVREGETPETIDATILRRTLPDVQE